MLIIYLVIISDTILCKRTPKGTEYFWNTNLWVCYYYILRMFLISCHSDMSKASRIFCKLFYYSQLSTRICYKICPSERLLIFFLVWEELSVYLITFTAKYQLALIDDAFREGTFRSKVNVYHFHIFMPWRPLMSSPIYKNLSFWTLWLAVAVLSWVREWVLVCI